MAVHARLMQLALDRSDSRRTRYVAMRLSFHSGDVANWVAAYHRNLSPSLRSFMELLSMIAASTWSTADSEELVLRSLRASVSLMILGLGTTMFFKARYANIDSRQMSFLYGAYGVQLKYHESEL